MKFTPRGGRVYVTLRAHGFARRALWSRTPGEGIATEFLPYVFERFRQADSTSTRDYGGLGLGLAIVRHLVELHGGTVAAESEGADKGRDLHRPAARGARSPPASTPIATPAITTASGANLECPPELAGLRVLVVDDEPDTRELIRTVLESCSALVTTASTATDALQRFQEQPPDLLVSDIGMQGKDGYWLIRQIRSLPAHRGGRVPAVAITAYAGTRESDAGPAGGFHQSRQQTDGAARAAGRGGRERGPHGHAERIRVRRTSRLH